MPANGDPESDWEDNQPEDNDENCAVLYLALHSPGWHDVQCNIIRHYICETNE